MKNTNEIIRCLTACADLAANCRVCGYAGERRCQMRLLRDGHAALAAAQDRCARYAEEIMVLRQQLEEVRHD